MSSPAAGSVPMAKSVSQKTTLRPTNAGGPTTPGASAPNNTSTPRSQQTPASQYFSPAASRLAGKHPSKTPALSTPTPSSGARVMASIESPALMGLGSGSTDGNLRMSGLGLSMGVSTGSHSKLDDAERRRRLEAVLATLGRRPGPISQAGVERLARRGGLELYQEPGEKKLMTLGGGNYAVDLIFASNSSPVVERVALHFFGLNDVVMEHADAAAEVLHQDLQCPPGGNALACKLDRFADNLERLSRLDKLSVAGASCFEAVCGVYTSLKRLYDHEKRAAERLNGLKGDMLDRYVLCKKSGRPQLHTRCRVGAVLDYWMDLQRLPSRQEESRSNGEAMDVDSSSNSKGRDTLSKPPDDQNPDQIYFLAIECEHCPPALYPPIRITADWLSSKDVPEPLPNPSENGEHGDNPFITQRKTRTEVEWLEPPSAITTAAENADLINTDEPLSLQPTSQQPKARFVARLEPSLFLPTLFAAQIFAAVDIDSSSDPLPVRSETFDSFVLGPPTPKDALSTVDSLDQKLSPLSMLPEPRHAIYSRTVNAYDHVPKSQEPRKAAWQTRLYVPHPDLSQEITSIPFSHPRQLIALLPRLRQYALLARLLRNSFHNNEPSTKSPPDAKTNGLQDKSGTPLFMRPPRRIRRVPDPEAGLNQLLKGGTAPSTQDHTGRDAERPDNILDVTLTQAYPVPRLNILIAARRTPTPAQQQQKQNGRCADDQENLALRVEILENGDVRVEGVDGDDQDDPHVQQDADVDMENGTGSAVGRGAAGEKKKLSDGDLTEGLAVCEDLGVWAEWIASRLGA